MRLEPLLSVLLLLTTGAATAGPPPIRQALSELPVLNDHDARERFDELVARAAEYAHATRNTVDAAALPSERRDALLQDLATLAPLLTILVGDPGFLEERRLTIDRELGTLLDAALALAALEDGADELLRAPIWLLARTRWRVQGLQPTARAWLGPDELLAEFVETVQPFGPALRSGAATWIAREEGAHLLRLDEGLVRSRLRWERTADWLELAAEHAPTEAAALFAEVADYSLLFADLARDAWVPTGSAPAGDTTPAQLQLLGLDRAIAAARAGLHAIGPDDPDLAEALHRTEAEVLLDEARLVDELAAAPGWESLIDGRYVPDLTRARLLADLLDTDTGRLRWRLRVLDLRWRFRLKLLPPRQLDRALVALITEPAAQDLDARHALCGLRQDSDIADVVRGDLLRAIDGRFACPG